MPTGKIIGLTYLSGAPGAIGTLGNVRRPSVTIGTLIMRIIKVGFKRRPKGYKVAAALALPFKGVARRLVRESLHSARRAYHG